MTATLMIDAIGVIRFVYRDELAELADCGRTNVIRASHVEPVNDRGEPPAWTAAHRKWAKCRSIHRRQSGQAMDAETQWLEENRL